MSVKTHIHPTAHGLWADTAQTAPATASLNGSFTTEIAVVGAGFTGLSAALHLASAGREVTVIDTGDVGQGCSGRNGGQVNPGWKLDLSGIANHYGSSGAGEEGATKAVGVALQAVPYLSSLIRAEGIDCDFIENGYVQGAIGARGLASIQGRAEEWRSFGIEAEILGAAEAESLLGTDVYDGIMHHAQGGNLQPLSFARGLAKAVLAKGGQIFTQTRALSTQRDGDDWVIKTEAGQIRAKQILIATNGYTDSFWPGLSEAVVSVASSLSATEPLSPEVATSILPGLHSVSETRRIQVYYRMTVDGRFVIGGRGQTFGQAEGSPTAHVRAIAEQYFPALKGVRWTHDWAGTVAMTWDSAPKLMQMDEGVIAGMGYNGRGVAMSTMMGAILACAAQGEATDLPITAPFKTPFHAFRKIGVQWTVTKGRFLDSLERRVKGSE